MGKGEMTSSALLFKSQDQPFNSPSLRPLSSYVRQSRPIHKKITKNIVTNKTRKKTVTRHKIKSEILIMVFFFFLPYMSCLIISVSIYGGCN